MRLHRRIRLIPRGQLKPRSNVSHGKFCTFRSFPFLWTSLRNAPGGAEMNAPPLKGAIYGGALGAAGPATTFVVARAVNPPAVSQQLQSQRDATIALLEDAITRG